MPVLDVCRQIGVPEATYCTEKKFVDLGVNGSSPAPSQVPPGEGAWSAPL